MNQKTVAQLTKAGPLSEEKDGDQYGDQYEGEDVIEAFFLEADIRYHDGVDDDE